MDLFGTCFGSLGIRRTHLRITALGHSYIVAVSNNELLRVQLKRDGTRWHTEGKWRGNWRMEWVASALHTTSEHGVSNITTADAHTSAASSRLNWRPRRFKWTSPFRRKTKSGFCVCAITFQTQSTLLHCTEQCKAVISCLCSVREDSSLQWRYLTS